MTLFLYKKIASSMQGCQKYRLSLRVPFCISIFLIKQDRRGYSCVSNARWNCDCEQ